jgi:hypothetical protein
VYYLNVAFFIEIFECCKQYETYVATGCTSFLMDVNIFNIFLMLQTLSFDVADVEYRCYRHVMLGVVSRRKREGAPNVGCCKH